MNRTILLERIKYYLSLLVTNVKMSNSMNLTDDSVNCENLFKEMLNCIYEYNLSNTNLFKANYGAIDLKDDVHKIIVQVTAQRNSNKIQETLNKEILKEFFDYTLQFILISDESVKYFQDQKYENPYLNGFDSHNIFSVKDLLSKISDCDIHLINKIEEIVQLNIVQPAHDIIKLESNLTAIINLLSQDELTSQPDKKLNEFEIERKIDFNNLASKRDEILDFSGYYSKLKKKYNILNLSGKNKEKSVLLKIHTTYDDIINKNIQKSENEIYDEIIEQLIIYIKESPNLDTICEEELLLAVEIVVCDAFIKCKIFKNPEDYNYVN